MPCRVGASLLAFLLAVSTLCSLPVAAQRDGGSRIVAVGDIHGAAAGLTQILRSAGLIDEKQRWAGGNARLVQTGDFTDRGDGVRQVIDLLMRLEKEAQRAGGRVDVLFGNHEGMNVMRDFRDVSPGAYASFADSRSVERRRKAFDVHAEIAKRAGVSLSSEEWMAARPLGFIEYVQAFAPSGHYGRWIRSRKAMLQIDDTIFMHAGLHPQSTGSIEDVNRAVERDVRSWDDLVGILERHKLASPAFVLQDVINVAQVDIGRIVTAQKSGEPLPEHVTQEYVNLLKQLQAIPQWTLVDAEGPLWYRGFATMTEDTLPAVEALLARLKAKRFVAGHTPQLTGGRIDVRFAGRVVLIDTGMLVSHYKTGQPSALEIHSGRLTAIYASGRQPLGTTNTQ